jgi:integrase
MSAQDSNKVSVAEGWARYQRKVRPASRWKDAAVPEYDPNWLVTFHVCGKSWTKTAVGCPVAMGPKPVTAWCKEEIRTQAWMIQSGNIQEAQARRAPPRTIYGSEVMAEYLRNVPAKRDYAKNAQRFRSILEEATGKDVAEVPVNEETLTRQLLFKWVRMRQEYFRRGWSAHGAAPADAWEILREELRAGNLPGIDKSECMEGNTTILTYLRCARSLFANHREYLGGLKLPELREFMTFSVEIEAPRGHREIPEAVALRIWGDAETLRTEDARLWVLLSVLAWTGARPAQVKGMTGTALEVQPDGSGVVLVPVAKGGRPVRWPVSPELAGAIEQVRTAGSLIGATSPTAAGKLHRRLNAWLRERGVEGTHAAYLLRHARGQQLREAGGVELAADGLGHTSTAMVQAVYTQRANVMPMLDPRPAALRGA